SDNIDFVLGAFAFNQRIDTQGLERQGSDASRWNIAPSNPQSTDPSVLDGLTALNTQWLKATSLALYGPHAWAATDGLTVQPGARINYDKKEGYYERRVFDGQGNPVPGTGGTAIQQAQRAIYAPQLIEPTFSDWNFSYDLTVSYEAAPDVLLYGTYAKTFK